MQILPVTFWWLAPYLTLAERESSNVNRETAIVKRESANVNRETAIVSAENRERCMGNVKR